MITMFKLKRILTNQKGVTLIELISVMSISLMLILISAVGLSVFFSKYRELNTWVEMQRDAMNCLSTMKMGVPVGTQRETEYYGITNARKLRLMGALYGSGTGTGITCFPPITDMSQAIDKSQFYFDGKAVRVNYVYRGVQIGSPQYLFPSRDNLDIVELQNFKITQENSGTEVMVVRVDLTARVKLGPKKYRIISFSTRMSRGL